MGEDLMPIVAISSALYLACFGLFQADHKRATVGFAQASDTNRRIIRYGAWGLIAATLLLLGSLQGYELAVPTWLGILCIVGCANLLISALWPQRHIASAAVTGAIAALSGTIALIGGLS